MPYTNKNFRHRTINGSGRRIEISNFLAFVANGNVQCTITNRNLIHAVCDLTYIDSRRKLECIGRDILEEIDPIIPDFATNCTIDGIINSSIT